MKKILVFIFMSMVLMSMPSITEANSTDPKIESMIEKLVLKSIMDLSGDVVKQYLKNGNLQIFPAIVYQSIQQVALQVFQQPNLVGTAREAFDKGMSAFSDLRGENASPAEMQQKIERAIDGVIKPLAADRMYQHVVKEVLKKAMEQHQRIIVMQAAQRNAQLAMIQRSYAAAQAAMVQQYQKAVVQQYYQQQQSARAAYERAVRQAQSEAEISRLKAEYEQSLKRARYQQELQRQQVLQSR